MHHRSPPADPRHPHRKTARRARGRGHRIAVPPALLAALAVVLWSGAGWNGTASGHPGALDQYGGHFGPHGEYHYHKPPRDMALRKQEVLEWARYPLSGTIKGVVNAVDDGGILWLYVAYRPAYQEMVQQVSVANRDDHKQLLRVDLAHVSPDETAARTPRFQAWFRKKVAHELRQKLLEKEVTVNFDIVGGDAGRLRGMVFQGEDNVNLWMVLNGLSYYVIEGPDNPYDKLFRQAEDVARRDKAGIWEYIR